MCVQYCAVFTHNDRKSVRLIGARSFDSWRLVFLWRREEGGTRLETVLLIKWPFYVSLLNVRERPFFFTSWEALCGDFWGPGVRTETEAHQPTEKHCSFNDTRLSYRIYFTKRMKLKWIKGAHWAPGVKGAGNWVSGVTPSAYTWF